MKSPVTVSVKDFLKIPFLLMMFLIIPGVRNSLIAQDTTLHEFITETARFYDNQLVTDGTFLYGVRYDGHVNGNGAIFKIKTDGSDEEVIFKFEELHDGVNPVGTLVLSGTTLYGMTIFGGENNMGVIFKIETDGSGFEKLLDFDHANGALPYASLIISESVLYGIAQQGGLNGMGLAFKINTDGSGYQKLLDFDGDNGHCPGWITDNLQQYALWCHGKRRNFRQRRDL